MKTNSKEFTRNYFHSSVMSLLDTPSAHNFLRHRVVLYECLFSGNDIRAVSFLPINITEKATRKFFAFSNPQSQPKTSPKIFQKFSTTQQTITFVDFSSETLLQRSAAFLLDVLGRLKTSFFVVPVTHFSSRFNITPPKRTPSITKDFNEYAAHFLNSINKVKEDTSLCFIEKCDEVFKVMHLAHFPVMSDALLTGNGVTVLSQNAEMIANEADYTYDVACADIAEYVARQNIIIVSNNSQKKMLSECSDCEQIYSLTDFIRKYVEMKTTRRYVNVALAESAVRQNVETVEAVASKTFCGVQRLFLCVLCVVEEWSCVARILEKNTFEYVEVTDTQHTIASLLSCTNTTQQQEEEDKNCASDRTANKINEIAKRVEGRKCSVCCGDGREGQYVCTIHFMCNECIKQWKYTTFCACPICALYFVD
ncbi:hypothetical protein EIN_002760 [Entamoeba invadens IP1]|uniref:Uncharacterized protein n=1 Tax=Entamoeba invadens IP1 TaxID=370355 RepID=A0A0A1TW95_ENTIV|nr:hypothetical protein EIN_002760 [Entamoeba invadens IP1]ELP84921.1 hypothetical protein EIN_002760 [Entamoeba invadens IP1]|eukprot:XP_004184267.1 hypothetical protein EIN_002760 [Entamoeba invadens IP1]